MPTNDATRRIALYLALVFGLSSVCYVLISTNGGLNGPGQLYALPLMWSPALAGLATTFIFQRNLRGLGWGLGRPVYYAIAYLLPILIVGVTFVFTWLRLASGSIWPAVLLHAVHNAFIQGVLDKLTADTGPTAYFTTELGLGLALMGVVVGLIFWRQGRALAPAPQAVGA